jgi:aminoglycoside 2'-N-acetyltransferase I
MSLHIITVSRDEMTPAQVDDVIELCSAVFECDYSYYMNLPLERSHVLGYVEGVLVAHALWLDRRLQVGDGVWQTAAYVEGVATREGYRGLGYASALMQRLQEEISDYAFGALSPRVPEWYERLGWVRWQGPLRIVKDGQVADTPDCVLVYRTPRTGHLDVTAALTGEWRPFDPW